MGAHRASSNGLAAAFNRRPLVELALGFASGALLSSILTGTAALIAACLFLLLAAFSYKLRLGYTPFLAALALMLLRALPLLPLDSTLPWEEVKLLADARIPVPDVLQRLSDSLAARSDALFYEASPLVRAVLLADRSELGYFASSAFRRAGVAHVLALSGLHISVLTGAVLLLVPKGRAALRLIAAGAFIFAYAAMTGFPPSLVRAGIMTLALLVSPLLARPNDPASAMAAALSLLLLASPMSIYDIGLVLSFSAVAGALMLTKPIAEALPGKLAPLKEAVALTVAASLGTLPVTLAVFGDIPVYSILTNLVVVPLISLALPLSLAALLASFVWLELGALLAFPARLIFDAAEYASVRVASLPVSVLHIEGAGVFFAAFFMLALLFLSRFCLYDKSRKLYTASAFLLASALALALETALV